LDRFVDGGTLLPLAVIGASLLGSLHCVGMCGGLVATLRPKAEEIATYHLGRLAGYTGLGALAGLLGSEILTDGTTTIASWIAAMVLGLTFIFMGISAWRGKGVHLFRLPPRLSREIFGRVQGKPLLLGLATAFLPCGWLHGFILAAIATRSASSGALLLLLFWLGTVPALTAAPVVIRRILGPLTRKAPRIVGVLLISAGMINIGTKMWGTKMWGAKMSTTGSEARSCHEMSTPEHHHHNR